MTLPDDRVWICGDWHGNTQWLQRAVPAMRRFDPSIRTILHLGDWWMDPEPVDYWCRQAGITRVLVTLGNHEPYDLYGPLQAQHPGRAIRISTTTWLLPRPWKFEIGGRTFVSLGGAASVDKQLRTEGKDWWPEEVIRESHVEQASRWTADFMVTHESPATTPVEVGQSMLARGDDIYSSEALAASAASRSQVDRVWSAVDPDFLFHGHMHIYGVGRSEGDRSVYSLGKDGDEGNILRLDLRHAEIVVPSKADLFGGTRASY